MTNPSRPNDPRHWARLAYEAQPKWPGVRLVPLAIEFFLEYQDVRQAGIYQDWEAAIIAQGAHPCIEWGTVLSGPEKSESDFAFIVCSQCQETLAAMVRNYWAEIYVPSHPEWQPPNPAELLKEFDALLEAARQLAEDAERIKNPQMVLLEG